MKKFFITIVFFLIVVIAGVYFARNIIVKKVIESSVKTTTGLDLVLGQVNIDLKNSKFGITQIQIKNPKGFEDDLMLNIPEVLVNINLREIFQKIIHLEEIRLNIDRLVVVKNKDGKLNLSAFKLKEKEVKAVENSKSESSSEDKAVIENFKIDSAYIKLGKIVYKDYSQGVTPVVKEMNANIEETMENITDIKSLFSTIAQKALLKSAMTELVGFDTDELKGQVQGEAQAVLEGLQKEADNFKLSF